MWARRAFSLIAPDPGVLVTRCDAMGAALSARTRTSKSFFLSIINLFSNLMSPRKAGSCKCSAGCPSCGTPSSQRRLDNLRYLLFLIFPYPIHLGHHAVHIR